MLLASSAPASTTSAVGERRKLRSGRRRDRACASNQWLERHARLLHRSTRLLSPSSDSSLVTCSSHLAIPLLGCQSRKGAATRNIVAGAAAKVAPAGRRPCCRAPMQRRQRCPDLILRALPTPGSHETQRARACSTGDAQAVDVLAHQLRQASLYTYLPLTHTQRRD